jgi:hypothetical protein
MATPQLVIPPPGATPAALRSSAGHHRALPPDLLRQASQRLGIMAVLAATLWAIGTLAGHLATKALTPAGDVEWRSFGSTDVIALLSIASSLVLFAYTRRGKRGPQFMLDLGLGYMVLMGFALGVMTHWDPPPGNWEVMPGISWIGVIVLIYPAIVPSDPRKMLVAALVDV